MRDIVWQNQFWRPTRSLSHWRHESFQDILRGKASGKPSGLRHSVHGTKGGSDWQVISKHARKPVPEE